MIIDLRIVLRKPQRGVMDFAKLCHPFGIIPDAYIKTRILPSLRDL